MRVELGTLATQVVQAFSQLCSDSHPRILKPISEAMGVMIDWYKTTDNTARALSSLSIPEGKVEPSVVEQIGKARMLCKFLGFIKAGLEGSYEPFRPLQAP